MNDHAPLIEMQKRALFTATTVAPTGVMSHSQACHLHTWCRELMVMIGYNVTTKPEDKHRSSLPLVYTDWLTVAEVCR